MEILLPDIQAVFLALLGGGIMGVVGFKLLPGMKRNAYEPREWMPISLVLTIVAWITYFLPQFLYDWLDRGSNFINQSLFVAVLFSAYMVAFILTLYVLQTRRKDRPKD